MGHDMKQFEYLKIKLEAIRSATNNFGDDNYIGKGGFSEVYNGEINHFRGRSMVAFKCLDGSFGQRYPDFWKEVMMLSFYRHENIVSLLGYCDEITDGEKILVRAGPRALAFSGPTLILVYEYASKRSLDLYLNSGELTWVRRLKICIGAARGLAYLHKPHDTHLRVLHGNNKSSNILIDENWNAKISDFGLSKFGPAVGALGYSDPLYIESGLFMEESDIYSFGVVLFEVLCGRLCIGKNNDKRPPLIPMVREHWEKKTISELIYGKIKGEIHPSSLKVFTEIAYQCLKLKSEKRPSMAQIIRALMTSLEHQCPKPPGILKVKVLRVANLSARYPYVVLKLAGCNLNLSSVNKTTVKYYNMILEWNQEFTLYVENPDVQRLRIWVQNEVSADTHENVGVNFVGLKRFITGERRTLTLNLYKDFLAVNSRNTTMGTIMVEMVYKPFPYGQLPPNMEDVIVATQKSQRTHADGGLLVVIIHEGGSLKGNHHTNPFVSLLFQGESKQTKSMNKSLNVLLWEEEFTFMLNEPPPTDETLHLEVINTQKGLIHQRKKSLGYVDISVADVMKKKRINKIYYLQDSKHKGWLEVELHWRTNN